MFLQIWDTEKPDGTISLVHSYSMRQFNWGYTQFSQFNADDTLLLVSGVYLGPHHSSSGEIAVFSLGRDCCYIHWLHTPTATSCWVLIDIVVLDPQRTTLCCLAWEISPMTCLAAGWMRPTLSLVTCTGLATWPPALCSGSTKPSRSRCVQFLNGLKVMCWVQN